MKILFTVFAFLYFAIFSLNAADSDILMMKIDGGIGVSTAEYVERVILEAEEQNYKALIIQLNTPGGLLDATRDIVESIMEAKVPIVVYVGPSGRRAASAGCFITLAAHYAVMAPGTNIGAAHPVGLGGDGGSDSSTVMDGKVVNDAAAFIRSIANERNRNANWAERTVRESISSTEKEALEEGAIDLIAENYDQILDSLDGRTFKTSIGEVTIKLTNRNIYLREMNWREEVLSHLSDPTIAYILMLLAMYGIMFELYNPGAIFPGVMGAIAGLLAAYSLQMLPVNYAGLGLIILSIILFILETQVSSFGLLSIGGVISFVFGSVFLIDSPLEFMEISMGAIVVATILTTLFFVVIVGLGLRAQTFKKMGGKEGMIDEIGISTSAVNPNKNGYAKIKGEIWNIYSEQDIAPNSQVKVVGVSGLKLKVIKASD